MKFIPFMLALIGLISISYVVHESIHWVGVEEPIRMCFGIEGELDDPAGVSGAKVYFTGRNFWYGSELVAYAIQVVFVVGGMVLLLKRY